MHILCEHQHVLDFKHRAVVQSRGAVESAEHLVLVGQNRTDCRSVRAVHHRCEVALESAVVGSEFPWGQVVFCAVRFDRNFKCHFVEFVRLPS